MTQLVFKNDDPKGYPYKIPLLDAFAYNVGDNKLLFDGGGEATFAVNDEMGRARLDTLLSDMIYRGVPHTRLKRGGPNDSYEYLYEPWNLGIVIDVHNPGWGNTFKAKYYSETIYLGRLRNFRAILSVIKEKTNSCR